MSPRLQKWLDRLDWFEGLWTTQCSFAIGALAAFIPLWGAIVALDVRARRAESFVSHVHNRVLHDMDREGIPTR